MTTFANITPQALTEGTVYCTGVPVTPPEAALGDAVQVPAVVPVVEGQTVVAVVKAWTNGHLTGNNTYIFLQTDLGDGVWVDVAWCRMTATDVNPADPQVFVLCGGGIGAMNNAFGPLRKTSATPTTQASGSNAVPLGGRIRFTGFSVLGGGSSSVAGTVPLVNCTITFKLQHPR